MTDQSKARSILAELQRRTDARRLDDLVAFFTDDALLIATTVHSRGPAAIRGYLASLLAVPGRILWDYDDVVVYHRGPGELGIAGFGAVVLTDGDEVTRVPFRLTVLAVETDDGWQLRMFHGSVPEAAA